MRQRLPRGSLAGARIPRVERVYFPATRRIPDAAAIRRLFPPDLYGAMVSFEISGAGRDGDVPLHGRARDDRAAPPRWATCTA